jgi:hypothetical protein
VSRELRTRERVALNALLAAEFAGAAALRAQAETVVAGGGPLIVDLLVDRSLPLAAANHRDPVQGTVEAVVDGEGHLGGLILFVDEGWLSALEYWWVTEDPPAGFPPAFTIGTPSFRS